MYNIELLVSLFNELPGQPYIFSYQGPHFHYHVITSHEFKKAMSTHSWNAPSHGINAKSALLPKLYSSFHRTIFKQFQGYCQPVCCMLFVKLVLYYRWIDMILKPTGRSILAHLRASNETLCPHLWQIHTVANLSWPQFRPWSFMWIKPHYTLKSHHQNFRNKTHYLTEPLLLMYWHY